MKFFPRIAHRIYRIVVKLLLQFNYDFSVWKATNLNNAPYIYCANHFSSSDAHFVTSLMKEDLHMMVGPGFAIPIVKTFLHFTEQIPALSKEDRLKALDKAKGYLDKDESVFIFPEGKLNKDLGLFYPGIAKLHLQTKKDIVAIGLIAPSRRLKKKRSSLAQRDMVIVSRNYYANLSEPLNYIEDVRGMSEDEALDYIINKIKSKIQFLIDDIKTNKFWS